MSKNVWGMEKRFDMVDFILLGVMVCGGIGFLLGWGGRIGVTAEHKCPPALTVTPRECPTLDECLEGSRFQLQNAMAICEDFKTRWENCRDK